MRHLTKTLILAILGAMGLPTLLRAESLTLLRSEGCEIRVEGGTVVFDGCNVQIVNGMGRTASTNGRGNLIVGYNETSGQETLRSGSHNLVVGMGHTYESYGGLVAGSGNALFAPAATIAGGANNAVSAFGAAVYGGEENAANGAFSTITGGVRNETWHYAPAICGGEGNLAAGYASAILGGFENRTAGSHATVSGGRGNAALAPSATVGGGKERYVRDAYDWQAGPFFADW
ncbi:MAG: hypothetical protein D6795_07690 [Deltaproteobacteria bacterium]|nr:MAG: hypothetical protein D6795_07690 [Deltaproteobacteria bacterium]